MLYCHESYYTIARAVGTDQQVIDVHIIPGENISRFDNYPEISSIITKTAFVGILFIMKSEDRDIVGLLLIASLQAF